VIGGADIFRLFLPLADGVELTEVLAQVDGDTFMDDPRSSAEWREVASEDHSAEQLPYRFVTLERV
jgi:dihydrofolate reductase